jgi:uncharacterized protein (DUF697 family)
MSVDTTQTIQTKQTKQTTNPEAKDGLRDEASPPDSDALPDSASRIEKAQAIIRRNVFWALGAGVVPVPVVDVMAVMAVQVKMLKEFSDLYGRTFSEGLAKKLVISLFSSAGIVGIGGLIAGSLVKVVPVLGSTLGVVTVPIIAGASAYATGNIFMMHLESGGTLLDFNPVAMRSHFKREFEKSKAVVSQMHQDLQAKAGNKPA